MIEWKSPVGKKQGFYAYPVQGISVEKDLKLLFTLSWKNMTAVLETQHFSWTIQKN